MKITSHVTSIHSKQAAKISAIMALVAVLAATWPLAGAPPGRFRSICQGGTS
jgi:hypothetical protein